MFRKRPHYPQIVCQINNTLWQYKSQYQQLYYYYLLQERHILLVFMTSFVVFFAVSMYCSMHTEWPFFTMFLCLERAFVYGQMSANGIRERVHVSSLINFTTLELCSTRLVYQMTSQSFTLALCLTYTSINYVAIPLIPSVIHT